MNEEDGKVYKKRAYMPDKEVGDLPPEMMAQIHMETISRLRAAGYSDPAIAKAGLSLGQSPVDKVTAGTDENDPLNLGLNAPGQGSPNDPLGLFDE